MALPYTAGPSAAGAAGLATVPGRLGTRTRITGCVFSYSVAPAAPQTLTITGRQSRNQLITSVIAGGPQSLTFGSTGVEFDENETVDGVLSAGAGAVIATLDLLADFIEQP